MSRSSQNDTFEDIDSSSYQEESTFNHHSESRHNQSCMKQSDYRLMEQKIALLQKENKELKEKISQAKRTEQLAVQNTKRLHEENKGLIIDYKKMVDEKNDWKKKMKDLETSINQFNQKPTSMSPLPVITPTKSDYITVPECEQCNYNKSSVKRFENLLNEERTKLMLLKTQYNKITGELQMANKKIRQLETENRISSEDTGLNEKIKDLEAEVEFLKESYNEREVLKDSEIERLTNQLNKVKQSQSQQSSSSDYSSVHDEEYIEQLRKKISELEKVNSELYNKHHEGLSRVQQLQANFEFQFSRFTQEKQSLMNQNSSLKKEKEQVKDRLQDAKNQIAQLQKQLKLLYLAKQNQSSEFQSIDLEAKERENQLKKQQVELHNQIQKLNESMKTQTQTFTNKLKEAEEKLQKVKQDSQAKKEVFQSHIKEMKQSCQQLEDLREKNKEMKAKIEQHQTAIMSLKSDNQKAITKLSQIISTLQSVTAKLQKANINFNGKSFTMLEEIAKLKSDEIAKVNLFTEETNAKNTQLKEKISQFEENPSKSQLKVRDGDKLEAKIEELNLQIINFITISGELNKKVLRLQSQIVHSNEQHQLKLKQANELMLRSKTEIVNLSKKLNHSDYTILRLEKQIERWKHPEKLDDKMTVIKSWFEVPKEKQRFANQPRSMTKLRDNIFLINWIEEYFRFIVTDKLLTNEYDH